MFLLDGAVVLPFYSERRDEGYLRVALGDPEQGAWVQGIANALRFRNDAPLRLTSDTASVRPDTSLYRTQYVRELRHN